MSTDRELLRELLRKHRRHVELSPGVGADVQTYALAVIDDIESDIAALAAPEHVAPQTHNDHPLRHFDRTCPACIAEGAGELVKELEAAAGIFEPRVDAPVLSNAGRLMREAARALGREEGK